MASNGTESTTPNIYRFLWEALGGGHMASEDWLGSSC
jgi:hypothetical protein